MNIPTSRWSRLYEIADEILALAPWKNSFEEDLFAIQPKADGPVYFASIMGSQGEHHAIAYYPGMESLSHFRLSQMEDIPERMALEAILLNRHLQLTFEPKRNLLPDDLEVLRKALAAPKPKTLTTMMPPPPPRQPLATAKSNVGSAGTSRFGALSFKPTGASGVGGAAAAPPR